MIDNFVAEYRWLSNFWPVYVEFDGELYPSVEHAYVAAKFSSSQTVLDPNRDWLVDVRLRSLVKQAKTAGKAKKLGQKYAEFIRPTWDKIKLVVMEGLLRQKFYMVESHRLALRRSWSEGEPLDQMLLDTGDQELVEGNRWHDNFWGICSCAKCGGRGSNHLGKLLMKVRRELREWDEAEKAPPAPGDDIPF